MIVILQRVSRALVRVDGEAVGEIGQGHVLLVGFGDEDQRRLADGPDEADAVDAVDGNSSGGGSNGESMDDVLEWMARKVVELRVFSDETGRMNLSLDDVGGSLLVVSQFTLYGDTRKGRRPSFVHAADPDVAEALYDDFLECLEALAPGRIGSGEFGAMMDVELVNDGPVTLVLER